MFSKDQVPHHFSSWRDPPEISWPVCRELHGNDSTPPSLVSNQFHSKPSCQVLCACTKIGCILRIQFWVWKAAFGENNAVFHSWQEMIFSSLSLPKAKQWHFSIQNRSFRSMGRLHHPRHLRFTMYNWGWFKIIDPPRFPTTKMVYNGLYMFI